MTNYFIFKLLQRRYLLLDGRRTLDLGEGSGDLWSAHYRSRTGFRGGGQMDRKVQEKKSLIC